MLEYLRIKNLALIEDLALELDQGFNVLTGETGAGKSFILKALGFLTGEKLAADLVRPGEDKAVVEALFLLPDPAGTEREVVLHRELAAESGRSRLRINDALSSQETIKALRPSLVAVTSQHGQQQLLSPAYQARLLDEFLQRLHLVPEEDWTAAEAGKRRLRELAASRQALETRSRDLAVRRELLEHQKSVIDKIAPEPGEEEALLEKRAAARNAKVLREAVDGSLALLLGEEAGLIEAADQLSRRLAHLADVHEAYADDVTWLEETAIRLRDLSSRLRRERAGGPSPRELEAVESRLYALAQLKRQLKRSMPEILALQSEIEESISFLDVCGLELAGLAREEADTAQALAVVLERLNTARREAATRFSAVLEEELRGLGFSPEVQVGCEFERQLLFADRAAEPAFATLGEDRARLLWRPNPGQPAQPLDRIASGGELSRFLLALVRSSAARDDVEQPTLLFDEIDTGVGGITLNHVAARLKELAGRRQILVVTHWPQLAALADRHFYVEKLVIDGNTTTRCRRLDGEDVFAELTRMAGGGTQGAALARELMGGTNKA
ncbi:DNA repair protein RecN [Megalodesulfovibrio gigas]|uniref:DNA repair protein RecN n=1 Tax=Megalodesulfovibrio gigas (strain ATCC 19364 / DSM 1382 / NCIMB 9332 / VKM B-1759) TaxID=1121448 RepID=T2GG66_MEGG1|nr:AAA family ATPase [Megalodesulfovibrio gigas]AGW15171.1 putative DNA repair protein RecN [Megalodesulfovibrio gigas DSM 1382 = ATCC 19364]